MQTINNHIVLIGFKHVGKSVIGEQLARKLNSHFIDMDQQIELLYARKFNEKLSCRQIMLDNGQDFFRSLEVNALRQIITAKPAVISLGGGTALHPESQRLIKSSILVHITAPRGIVFERIRMSGRPAFFKQGEDLLESFNRLWDERKKIFEDIQDYLIINDGSVENAVDKIANKLNIEG